MTYMTAKTYTDWERIGKPFDKNGKLYQKVKTKCPRCGGLGIIVARVENGQPIPIPVDQGICYQCAGNRYITKDVRLYTETELQRMETANEKAKAKRQAEQEQKMKAEFAQKKADWLAKNGFTPDGVTYIVTGDSYSIKEELKTAGFRYDSVLRWHKADPAGYEDKVIKINVDDYFEFSAWGEGHYITGAKDKIDNLLAGTQPQVNSNWIGEVGGKIKDLTVELIRKYSFDGKYGLTTVLTFKTQNDEILTWFTSTIQPYEKGDWVIISSATIKDHTEYKGVKQTQITRARLKNIDEVDNFNWENEILNG